MPGCPCPCTSLPPPLFHIEQVHDFLPPFVAEGALQILQGVPPGRWNDTAADEVGGGWCRGGAGAAGSS